MRCKIQSFIILLLFSFIVSICVTARGQSIDPALAQKYFQEAAMICRADNGRLWGHSLCGPMIFFDPATRTVVANQSDKEGRLTKKGDVFVGRVPDEVNCANTAIDWAGVRWSMIFWFYLGEDKYDRDRLMIHESFHRIQQEIGLPMSNPSNNHLDSMEGRIWLQLEWRALRQALTHQDKERSDAMADALVFRLYRRALFPQAAAEEKALEMNEGLAEYTGVKLSGRTAAELDAFIARRLAYVNERPTFTRSFAYESGPAYGLLLDGSNLNWRRHLKPSNDLGELLQKTFSLKLPDDLRTEAQKRAGKYDGENLRTAEAKREQEKMARLAAYRAKLVEGARLILPLSQAANYSFNPNNLVPLDDSGTIYPTMRVTDAWGILDVKDGALMVRENNKPALLYVPLARDVNARPLQGDGWTLQLNDRWTLAPAERQGDYVLKMK